MVVVIVAVVAVVSNFVMPETWWSMNVWWSCTFDQTISLRLGLSWPPRFLFKGLPQCFGLSSFAWRWCKVAYGTESNLSMPKTGKRRASGKPRILNSACLLIKPSPQILTHVFHCCSTHKVSKVRSRAHSPPMMLEACVGPASPADIYPRFTKPLPYPPGPTLPQL